MSDDRVLMTPEDMANLEAEVERLETVDRAAMAERIKVARELGDLSENADYHDAKAEQADALTHWRELAITVLTAARSATGAEGPIDGQMHGRATIVLEDSGGEEVTVHATFWPEMQDLGGGEVSATPAQIAALELLDQLAGDEEEPED